MKRALLLVRSAVPGNWIRDWCCLWRHAGGGERSIDADAAQPPVIDIDAFAGVCSPHRNDRPVAD